MYSIINAGGTQHKVLLGSIVRLPQKTGEIGSEIEFLEVLAVREGSSTTVGAPLIDGAMVKGEILSHGKDKTVKVFKKKRRQGYRKTIGHRQPFTEIIVTEMKVGGETSVVDKVKVERARARAAAIARRKEQAVPLTLKEKIAQGVEKPAKVKKNSLRKSGGVK